jgi:hypothetical protein
MAKSSMTMFVHGWVEGHHTYSGARWAPLAQVPVQLLKVMEL